MRKQSYRKASPETVAKVLDAMTQRLSVNEILRTTGVSTTVLYKVIADYPLWASYIQRRDE